GINSNNNEPASEVAEHAKKHDLAFPILKDGGNKVADAYGANHTPEAYLIDAKGALVYHGRIDESKDEADARSHDLANAIDALGGGKPVPVAETKAFGCSIKRVCPAAGPPRRSPASSPGPPRASSRASRPPSRSSTSSRTST